MSIEKIVRSNAQYAGNIISMPVQVLKCALSVIGKTILCNMIFLTKMAAPIG